MIVSTGSGLRLVRILDRGHANKERIHLEAVRDCDTSYFVVLQADQLSENTITAGSLIAYWFEPVAVRAGDYVILYTKTGTYSKNTRNDGHENHFFYWGQKSTMFNNPSKRIVLMELNTWVTGA